MLIIYWSSAVCSSDLLVHRQRIIEVSAEHHAVDLLGIADVLCRIGIENHEVGELAGLERSDVLGIAERCRGHDRRGAQRVDIAPAAANERPDFPMRAEPRLDRKSTRLNSSH